MFEQARKTLKIARDADPETVRQAYVRLVRRYPPEHFPEKFVDLRQAYQQLTLDDNFIREFFKMASGLNLLALKGLMWNDREELHPKEGVSLTDLLSDLEKGETLSALDEALDEAMKETTEKARKKDGEHPR